jgi:gas vesicle protein
MAEEKIEISIEFDGSQQTVRQLGEVSSGVQRVGASADTAAANFNTFAQRAQSTVQRVQGVAGAIQSLTSALGSSDRTAGLVASVAGATAQFAAMGSMLGPAGTVVGGIVGFASSMLSLSSAHSDAREEIRSTTSAIRDEGDAAITAAEAMDQFLASVTTASRRNELTSLGNTLTSLSDQLVELRDSGDALGAMVLEERIRTLSRMEEALRSDIEEETRTIGAPRRAESGGARGGGRAERPRNAVEELMSEGGASNRDIADIGAEMERLAAERVEREAEANALIEEKRNAHYEALKEMAIEAQDAELERQREVNEALAEMERERQERIREGQLAEKENQEAEEERSLDRRRSLNGELMGLLGDATMAFGKSLAAIATGEQTAEEAFQGLAKAFLEMISQYATMKAATEFADAAASFAKYDYAGGAAHIGAGVAFTAIAVATGVGAAAIGSAPSAPARPESGGGAEAAQGGDVVINWNSPVITAGTQAELGRELQAAVSAAGSI